MATEEVPPHVNGAQKGVIGLLGHLHYNVSKEGPNQSVRQARLRYIYGVKLITGTKSDNSSYVAEFGDPETDQRYYKIKRVIEGNLDRFGDRQTQAWIDCVEKWEDDIEWFVKTFGENHGDDEPYFG
jgi:hypothetical protein